VSSLGSVLGVKFANQESVNQSLSHEGDSGVPKLILPTERVRVTEIIKIDQEDWSGSNSFILGHSINGVLGVANGMGGGQIVLGYDGVMVESTILQRRWEFVTTTELETGTASPNVSVEGGQITLK